MGNYFLKRAHYASLIMLICILILCGIYAAYIYRANASNSHQPRATQQGLLVVAHSLQVPTPAPIQVSKPVQLSNPLLQQPVQPSSIQNINDWQNYFKKRYHLP